MFTKLNQAGLYKDKRAMVQNRLWTSMVFLTCILATNAARGAIRTEEIDAVRQKALVNKDVLEDSDFEVIDAFWAASMEELLLSEDLSEIADIRSMISARRGGSEPSQYSAGFITSAQKHLKSALDEVEKWDSDRRKTWIERNLMILTAELDGADLVEIGMRMLGYENGTVRYWAAKSVTSPTVITKLNSELTQDTELATEITGRLSAMAEKETHPEILNLIAGFAGRTKVPVAKQLLLKVVDLRTKAYENWTVEYELMDSGLLKSLSNEILSQGPEENKAVISRKFAQLYSYVMQRYILGASVLSDVSKQQLASVLVDVEQSVVGKLLGRPQSTIKKAIEKILTKRTIVQRDYATLQGEHDSLFGSTTQKGYLPTALNFDYGKNPGGSPITTPKKLGPPKSELKAEAAKTSG
jgi:hypothetical protein